jgi:hypothetical protein
MAGEWVASVYSRLGLESVALRRVATQGSPWNLLPFMSSWLRTKPISGDAFFLQSASDPNDTSRSRAASFLLD